jgi:transposase
VHTKERRTDFLTSPDSLEQQAAGSAEAVARRRAETAELQQLRRDNKRLQEENEILRKASAFFARWAEKA